jgi:hypothetical protein
MEVHLLKIDSIFIRMQSTFQGLWKGYNNPKIWWLLLKYFMEEVSLCSENK